MGGSRSLFAIFVSASLMITDDLDACRCVAPSSRRPKTQAGCPELPPCPPVSRRRPASEAFAVPLSQCCRTGGSAAVQKAARSPCSRRIVSHGQYITKTVKRSTINAVHQALTGMISAGFLLPCRDHTHSQSLKHFSVIPSSPQLLTSPPPQNPATRTL